MSISSLRRPDASMPLERAAQLAAAAREKVDRGKSFAPATFAGGGLLDARGRRRKSAL